MKRLTVSFDELKIKPISLEKIQEKLEGLIDELKKCGSSLTANEVIKKWNKYQDELSTNFTLVQTRYSMNTLDKKLEKLQEQVNEVNPVVVNYAINFYKILLKAKYRKDLEKMYGVYLFKMYENMVRSFDERVVEETIEENKLVSKYDQIIGSAQIEFEGGTYNLSQMSKFTTSTDRDTRKKASMKIDEWFLQNEKEIGDIYSKLVLLRDKKAKKLGFKNFVELGYLSLGRVDYDAKMVKKYREQIFNEVVPISNQLFKEQIKSIGIKNPQFYDYNLKFKTGNPTPKGDEQYLVEQAQKMYDDLSPITSEFFHFMRDKDLMDLSARKGKIGGGYCTSLSQYNAPFVFANFNGTSGDVNVLTHEIGHALQFYLSSNIKISEYRNPTLEACEIHSMSMEFFAWPYMELFFKEDADKYRYDHLKDAICFLPYGITIDEFQHWVYENPNATHEERCQKYLEIERRNLPHKKYDECPFYAHGGWWMKQSHLFGSPFYYIDYTLAQVVAFQFFIESRKNKEKAWKKYIKLCKFGGRAPFISLLEANKLRNPFTEGNVKKNVRPLIKILKGFDTSKF